MPLIRLAQLFAAAGHTLYGVGGMVRNPLLGLPVTEFFIQGEPEEVFGNPKTERTKQFLRNYQS